LLVSCILTDQLLVSKAMHVSSQSQIQLAIVNQIIVGSGPDGVVYDPTNGNIYVSSSGDGYVYDVKGGTSDLPTPIFVGQQSYPEGIVAVPSTDYLYVADRGLSNISIINGTADTVIGSITVGLFPYQLVYGFDTAYLFVSYTNGVAPNVTAIYGNQVITNVSVPYGALYLAYDQKDGEVFAAFPGENVSVISEFTDKVVGDIPIPGGPMIYNPQNGCLYVSEYPVGQTIAVINATTDKLIQSLNPFIGKVTNFAYDSLNGDIFLAAPFDTKIYELDGILNSIVANVSVGPYGSYPENMAFDPANGYLYVADFGSNTLVVIANTNVASSQTFAATTSSLSTNGTLSTTAPSSSSNTVSPTSIISIVTTTLTVTKSVTSTILSEEIVSSSFQSGSSNSTSQYSTRNSSISRSSLASSAASSVTPPNSNNNFAGIEAIGVVIALVLVATIAAIFHRIWKRPRSPTLDNPH
jgi:YVTN family beta-propeller protein